MADFKTSNVQLRANFKRFEEALKEIPGDKKIRYAIALNKIVDDIRDHARDDFPRRFKEKGANRYMRRGIVSHRAKSSHLVAKVGTINSLLGLHMKGGTKTGNVAMEGIRGENGRGVVTRTTTVENLEKLIAKKTRLPKKYFKLKLKGQEYIMRKDGALQDRKQLRKGKTRMSQAYPRGTITPMWLLMGSRRTKIKSDWDLEKIGQRRMAEAGPRILQAVLEDSWDHAVKKGRLTGANPYHI